VYLINGNFFFIVRLKVFLFIFVNLGQTEGYRHGGRPPDNDED